MNNSLKAFIISLLIYTFLFIVIFNYEIKKPEKKELIVLNMNMIQNIVQAQKQEIQEEKIPESEQIKESEPVIEPEPIKEPLVKKELPKKIEKQKPKKEPPKKVQELKEVQKTEVLNENTIVKEEPKNIEKIDSEPNYQQRYIDNNLANIIAAIKKYKKYPFQAKKLRMTGTAVIQCTITTSGKVINVKIIESSKYDLLDENSLEILQLASKEFIPPKKEVTLNIPFNYELN